MTERSLRGAFARGALAGDLGRFVLYVVVRFINDNGLQLAGSLTYTTLLSLVPTAVVAFAILAGVPAFESFREQILETVFTNLLPGTMETLREQFNQFADNAGGVGLVGLVGMGVTALLILSAIEGACNTLWHVTEARTLASRVVIYWAFLTLGPLIFGASISLTSYLYAAAREAGIEGYTPPWLRPAIFAPIAIAWLGYAFLYYVMPHRTIELRHALIGGAIAALAFEALKRGFAWYVVTFPSYQAIYGALAAVPILLVWTYLVWLVTLLGATLTASLPDWRNRSRWRHVRQGGPAPKLAVALAMLGTLRQASRQGRQLERTELKAASEAPPDTEDQVLDKLKAAHFAVRTGGDRWLLGRDLAACSLYDLVAALELVPFGGEELANADWAQPYRDIVDRVDADQRDLMSVPLDRLLGGALPAHDGGPDPADPAD